MAQIAAIIAKQHSTKARSVALALVHIRGSIPIAPVPWFQDQVLKHRLQMVYCNLEYTIVHNHSSLLRTIVLDLVNYGLSRVSEHLFLLVAR